MSNIDWNDVVSATAQEDGLHVKMRDGRLGVLVLTPGAVDMQRKVICSRLSNMLADLTKALVLLQSSYAEWQKSPHAASGDKRAFETAIQAAKDNVNALGLLMNKLGCLPMQYRK